MIEATAFGTHTIIRNFAENGVPVDELYACGGLAERNALLMQIYADVTGIEIKLSASSQTPALGSAMFGALAAGSAKGGYDDIIAAARQMAQLKTQVFRPDPAAHAVYQQLYAEYIRLHDYFGRGQNNVMKTLKSIRDAAIGDQPHLDALVGLEAEAADVSLSGERRR